MPINGHNALGLYISIPFCRSKCTYCNFASGVYPASDHARYVDRLIEDLHAARGWAEQMGVHLPSRVDTVYLGGGTPTLLASDLLVRLFAAMRAEFDFDPDAEITVECAPGQLADDTLAALAGVGVNRVSLGVQSFIELKDVAAFSADAMGAQIGGVLSLWLGVTVMFAFEAFEFLYLYLTNCRKEDPTQGRRISVAPMVERKSSDSVAVRFEY